MAAKPRNGGEYSEAEARYAEQLKELVRELESREKGVLRLSMRGEAADLHAG
jgi:hypothetical protein